MASSSSQGNDVFVCEWTISDGTIRTICGATFTNHPLFTSHVIEAHISTTAGSDNIEIECPWNLCHFSPPDQCHLLFHAYHTLLKSKGADYQLSKGLPLCQMGNDLSNTIPTLPSWKCEWEERKGERCGQTFVNPALFYNHVKEHVRCCDVNFTCKWTGCTFSAKTQWNLVDHTRTHTQEKIIACHVCGLLFSSTTRLRDHLQRQNKSKTDPKNQFSCSICKKTFSTERLLREHLRKHVNTCKCPHCPMTCINNSALLQHIRYRHSTSRPYRCPLCGYSCKTHGDLSEHLLTHQSGQKSICPYPGCGRISKTVALLLRHIKEQHPPTFPGKLYCCHVCNVRFSIGTELTSHLKSSHSFSLPPGHSRFRYISCDDGLKRLQTVRIDKDDLHSTPS